LFKSVIFVGYVGQLEQVISEGVHSYFFTENSNSLGIQKLSRQPTVSVSPIVIEPVSDFGVDGAHRLHVRLPPLTAQILSLHLQQLQYVQLEETTFVRIGTNQAILKGEAQ
jgi:hypothetical protein